MPAFLAALLTGLFNLCKSKLGYFVATAFVWLGINWGSYHFVISPLVEQLYTYVDSVGSSGGRLGELALRALGLLNFDRALTMIISAYVSRFAMLTGRLYLFKRGYGVAPPASPKIEPVVPPAG